MARSPLHAPMLRVFEWRAMAFRRLWRANLVTSFGQPLLFLVGMGLGVGSLVSRSGGQDRYLGGVDYLTFLAPGLLATTAMVVASVEASWPVMGAFKWNRSYHAMQATPVRALDMVLGELLWMAARVAMASAAVAVVLAALPKTRSSGAPLAVLGAVLCGLAFAAPILAFAATRERDSGFSSMQRFVITPLFLFGGAFYPVAQLPALLRSIAYVTPLWHGVELCRGAMLHTLGAAEGAGHALYLIAWCVAGIIPAVRLFERRLAP